MSDDFYAVRFEDENTAYEVLWETKEERRDPSYLDIAIDEAGKKAFQVLNRFANTDLEYDRDLIRNQEDIIPRSQYGRTELEKTLRDTDIEYELIG